MNAVVFRGKTIRAALQAVKQSLGEGAIILQERKGPAGVELLAVPEGAEEHELLQPGAAVGSRREALRKLGFVADGFAKASAEQARLSLRACVRGIVERVPCQPQADQYTGVLRLVGPSGAGKTTTLLKLLSLHVQTYGNTGIGVVNQRQTKLGAQATLEMSCRLLDIPYAEDTDDSALHSIQPGAKGRLLLIDTCSETVVGPLSVPGTTLLVCPATLQFGQYSHLLNRFSAADLAGAVLTQMDQSIAPGCALEAITDLRLPLWWLSTGTHLPVDLVHADRENLLSLLMQRTSAKGVAYE